MELPPSRRLANTPRRHTVSVARALSCGPCSGSRETSSGTCFDQDLKKHKDSNGVCAACELGVRI